MTTSGGYDTASPAHARHMARVVDAYLARAHVPRVHREPLTGRARFLLELVPDSLRTWESTLGSMVWVGGSALLCGPPGVGKTLAATWVLAGIIRRAVIDEFGEPRTGRCASVCFARVADLRQIVRERAWERLREIERAQALVLDDAGLESDPDGRTAADVDELIDRRWADRRVTIVTTNLLADGDPLSFRARYARAFSRLADARGPGVVEIVREVDLRLTPPTRAPRRA